MDRDVGHMLVRSNLSEPSLHCPAIGVLDHAESVRDLERSDVTSFSELGCAVENPTNHRAKNRIAVAVAPAIYLDRDTAARLARRLAPATRHLGLEKVTVRFSLLDHDKPDAPAVASGGSSESRLMPSKWPWYTSL